jgi:hypothetical protein
MPDEVIGPQLEAGHAVRLLVARRQHDHRDASGDPPADLKPVDTRQADVEHDQLDRVAPELDERVLAGSDPQCLVALAAKVCANEPADVRLILDDHHERAPRDNRRSTRGVLAAFLHAADL